MIELNCPIFQYGENGDKSGWTYIEIHGEIAQRLVPGMRKSFRVKGSLDNFPISGVALIPVGEGDFILPINGVMRKGIKKGRGDIVRFRIEAHLNYQLQLPAYLAEFFSEEPAAQEFFNSLPKSHRDYFVKWIESAKTETTKIKRIVQTVEALSGGLGYPEMIRMNKLKNADGRDSNY